MSITKVDAEEFIESSLWSKWEILLQKSDDDVMYLRQAVDAITPQVQTNKSEGARNFALMVLDEELRERGIE